MRKKIEAVANERMCHHSKEKSTKCWTLPAGDVCHSMIGEGPKIKHDQEQNGCQSAHEDRQVTLDKVKNNQSKTWCQQKQCPW